MFFLLVSLKGLIVFTAEPAAAHMGALKKCRSCITKHLDYEFHVNTLIRTSGKLPRLRPAYLIVKAA